MENILNKNKQNNTTNKSLAPEITKWSFILSTCVGLIIAGNDAHSKNIEGIKEINEYENRNELFYNTLRNEMLFTLHGFIKTINILNPDNITDSNLIKHEQKILKAAEVKLSNGVEIFSLTLSSRIINNLNNSGLIDSFVYLLNSIYGKGYSEILTDGNDHSDKELIVDIMRVDNKYILREIRIGDYSPEEEKIDNKDSSEKIKTNNNKILKA